MTKIRLFSLRRSIETAPTKAEYKRDEDQIIIALVPNAAGFFAQGEPFEEARENLPDVVEGNVRLALQLGLTIPAP